MKTCCLTMIVLTLIASQVESGVITLHAPSAYDANVNVLNANLGLTDPGLTFEDFGDASLASGLTITTSNPVTVPYNPSNGSTTAWTAPLVYRTSGGSDTTFSVAGGVTRFGVGLGNVNDGFEMSVNGGAFVDLIGTVGLIQSFERNGYLVIDADATDPLINSVTFRQAIPESIYYDHVAFGNVSAVPEPSTFAIMGLGVIGMGAYSWRRRRKAA